VVNAITTSDSLTPFTTNADTVGTPFTVGGDHPTAAVITPDARTAWVLLPAPDSNSDASLVPVDLTQNPPVVGSGVAIPGAISNTQCTINSVDFLNGADNLALNPAGTTAYVADFITDSVYPVDLTQSPPTVGTPIALPSGSLSARTAARCTSPPRARTTSR
jgi:DNA-binding beta-propeller fold protein YncE